MLYFFLTKKLTQCRLKLQMRTYFKHHGMGIEVLPLGIDEEQGHELIRFNLLE